MKSSLIVFAILLFSVSAGFAKNQHFSCGTSELIEIAAKDDALVGDICQAFVKAISFLGEYQLHPKRLIRIEVVMDVIDAHGYLAYGSFDRQSDLIKIMSFKAVLNNSDSPTMYGQPFDMEHYHGAIAHEIAHAVFHQNTGKIKEQLTNVTQEYLAHSTQLGILSEERRTEIICSHDVGAWESGDSISEVYMGFTPTGFAVKSYLHLTQLEDPQPFVKILLNNNWFYVSVP